jgi:hypothetical protein
MRQDQVKPIRPHRSDSPAYLIDVGDSQREHAPPKHAMHLDTVHDGHRRLLLSTWHYDHDLVPLLDEAFGGRSDNAGCSARVIRKPLTRGDEKPHWDPVV